MVVRKIKEEEARRTDELFSVAFEFSIGNADKSQEELLRKYRENPENRFEKYFADKWAAFESEGGDMMAYIGGTPYDVEFDGSTVKMSGVGGVSSLPQYRRKGAIRGCFSRYLRDIYEDGFVFSTLYPFSAAYYRQFGYECGELVNRYQVPLAGLPVYNVGGRAKLLEKGNLLPDIETVYNAASQGINLACRRDRLDYGWALSANPAKDEKYTYVYYNEEGTPKGFLTFTKDCLEGWTSTEGPLYHMNCSHFCFADLEGFKGLMNHCRAFAMYYNFVSFTLPAHLRIENLIPERSFRNPLHISRNMNGMVRAVNVKRALELARYQGSGSLVLRVKDGVLPENDGDFSLSFRDGRAVSVEKCASSAPDVSLPIGDFSRFILGTHAAEELRFVEAAEVSAPLAEVGKVFYKKPVYITEHF